MRLKSKLSAVLVLCTVLLTLPIIQVFAAGSGLSTGSGLTYHYRVIVKTTGETSSEGDAGKVQAVLVFGNQTFYGTLNNANARGTKERPGSSVAYFNGVDHLETSMEPYMLTKVGVKCNSTNGFKVGVVEVDLLKSTGIPDIAGSGETMFYQTFNKWVDMDDGHNQVEYMDFSGTSLENTYKRYINKNNIDNDYKSLGNFPDFGGSFHFGVNDTPEDKAVDIKWDGLAKYAYKPANVPVFNTSAPPTLSATVSGLDRNGVAVDEISVLSNKGIFSFDSSNYSFSYNKKKVKDYMDQKGCNQLKVDFNLRFSDETTRKECRSFSRTITFTRDVFTLHNFSLSSNYNNALVDNVSASGGSDAENEQKDNLYYYDSSNKQITVTSYIKRENNYDHIKKGKFKDCELKFDEAYLTSENGLKLYAVKEGTEDKVTSVKVDGNDNCVKFYFSYDSEDGLDTENKGLTLVINGGYISADSTKYMLWDDESNSVNFKRLYSKYKIDSIKPSVTVSAATDKSGNAYTKFDNGEWNKYVQIVTTATENIFTVDGNKVYEGYATMKLLTKSQSAVKIYKYNFDPNSGSASSSMNYTTIPAVKGSTDMPIFVTPATEVEGDYYISISGYDRAGNYFSNKTPVNLDNKPPTVVIREEAGNKVAGNSLTNKYKMTIQDGSGTGTLYYVFTENSESEVIAALKNGATDKSKVTGELSTTIDEWACIKKSDIKQGETMTAVLSVADGGTFNGRIIYYAVDDAGNTSPFYSREISMDNRNTTISITPDSSAVPADSYKISIVPKSNANTIEYCWVYDDYDSKTKKTTEKQLTDYVTYKTGTVIDTSIGEMADKNGEFYLKVKVTPPGSGSSSIVKKRYVFDNEGPEIYAIVPSTDSVYGDDAGIYVSINDSGEVVSATARLVNPDETEITNLTLNDGTVIDKTDDITLNIKYGFVSEAVTISDVPSGAYALKITAYDINGTKSEYKTDAFFIRNSAPETVVSASNTKNSNMTYNGYPLIEKGGKVSLNLDVKEKFLNSSYSENQVLYYRATDTVGEWGNWIKVCEATSDENGLSAAAKVDLPYIPLVETENTLYVQTAIFTDGADTRKIGEENITTSELMLYYDETAPIVTLVIDDVHQKESISGKIIAADNLNGGFTVEYDKTKMEIGSFENGEATITVKENVNENITVYDSAGNKTDVKVVINGIDYTAPEISIVPKGVSRGARQDATVTVNITDVADGTVRFALIPTGEYNGSGTIDEKYFRENLEIFEDTEDFSKFKISKTRSENGRWDGESNLSYQADISGMTGDWYIGVQASDSLGNKCDVISDNFVTLTDVEADKLSYTVTPKETETTAIVTVKFNVPVYVLPQKDIKASESDNLALAKKNAMSYSTSSSFVITKPDGWTSSTVLSYDLYIVDELGRAKKVTLKINDVTFDVASNVSLKVERYKLNSDDTYTLASDNEYISANDSMVYVSSETTGVLLMPEDTDGFNFDKDSSVSVTDTENKVLGYTKLAYVLEEIDDGVYIDDILIGSKPREESERILKIKSFPQSDPTNIGYPNVIITNIDNTPPVVNLSSSPEVMTVEAKRYGNEISVEYVTHPTPTDVIYAVTAQDKETGISEVVAVRYYKYSDYLSRGEMTEEIIPSDATDWTWDGAVDENGNERDIYIGEEYNEETGSYETVHGTIPVTIQYYGDGDKFGVKKLYYTFSDSFKFADYSSQFAIFVNGLGDVSLTELSPETNIHTEGIIYKMPIEEGMDFGVILSYENSDGNWVNIDEAYIDETYYKTAKVKIDIDNYERGVERGVYIANNGGSNEKVLNNYQNSYTFILKDKLGYTFEKTVTLNNFDITAGTLSYSLSTTANTNETITLTVTAEDDKSGIDKVLLVNGSNQTELTQTLYSYDGLTGTFEGDIDENGTYSVVMYDKAGNKTVKSFNVKNIDKTKPALEKITYKSGNDEWVSCKNDEGKWITYYKNNEDVWTDDSSYMVWTSRPVTATLTFSKQDVSVTTAKPSGTLTSGDYSVNYRSSVITFTKAGTLSIDFTDAYGNTSADTVTVKNIDTTPPMVEPDELKVSDDYASVSVTFKKLTDLTSQKDIARDAKEIYVNYGGITKAVLDENGNKNSFTFTKKGTYSFKVYDKEGLYSICNVEIDGIDTGVPKITKVTWEYDYYVYDSQTGEWKLSDNPVSGSVVPSKGAAGYRIVPDENNAVTNQDVTVKIETDNDTRLSGTLGEYEQEHEKVYDENGMFIFNAEKPNGNVASYGVDIQIIDKTPPVIELSSTEMLFYENSIASTFDKSMLMYVENGKYKAFSAYDDFNGKRTYLDTSVEIDWGGFNYENPTANTFDSSTPYTITYTVSDSAHNVTKVTRTVRLVGINDTIVTVNGSLPDYAGRCTVSTDTVTIGLENFNGTAYVRHQSGIKTMGQMKKMGTVISKNSDGKFEISGLSEGWHTFYIQTDRRDYFTLNVYVSI